MKDNFFFLLFVCNVGVTLIHSFIQLCLFVFEYPVNTRGKNKVLNLLFSYYAFVLFLLLPVIATLAPCLLRSTWISFIVLSSSPSPPWIGCASSVNYCTTLDETKVPFCMINSRKSLLWLSCAWTWLKQ